MPGPLAAAAVPLITSGIQALMGFFGNRSGNKAADRAAQLQYQAAMRAAAIQERAQAEQLALLREQEETRKREWQQTQDRNHAIYQAEQAREQQRYGDLQSRMAPYRKMGVGSLAQLARPIPSPGSIGARAGG